MQDETLFIADLHLDSSHPEISKLFLGFLDTDARKSDALYILGDLFEVWLGDDDNNPEHRKVIKAIKQLTSQGTSVYIQHGNRDFLIGSRFESLTGCQLLPDPSVIELYGNRILLMHGDLLCTDDIDYQQFRQQVRDPDWIRKTLQLPLKKREQIAKNLRKQSQQHTQTKPEDIMDVNPDTVKQYMQDNNTPMLIHGHTHRPAIHELDNKTRRIVLGDWVTQGSVLRWNRDGYRLQSIR